MSTYLRPSAAPRRWRVKLRWVGPLVVAALALIAGVYFDAGGRWLGDRSPPVDSAALLGVTLPDTRGQQHEIGQWKGKVLVVNFWATWCVPCREEMPVFVAVQRELGERGLQFVGIAIDEPAKVDAFAKELSLNYPLLIGGYGAIELSKTLGNRLGALPFTLVLDRGGRVVLTQLGPLREPQLRSIVGQLL